MGRWSRGGEKGRGEELREGSSRVSGRQKAEDGVRQRHGKPDTVAATEALSDVSQAVEKGAWIGFLVGATRCESSQHLASHTITRLLRRPY